MQLDHRRPKEGPVPPTQLIVEDDPINRAILEQIFAPHYTIEQAEDGQEGLEKILAQPDRLCAVLLDVLMPGLDGIQVLRRMQAEGLPAKLPVFLITADARDYVM